MNQDSQNHQNEMLNTARKERKRVLVFLKNGIRLLGHVESFDQYVVMLSSTSGTQAIYKHAISTVQEDSNKAHAPSPARAAAPAAPAAPREAAPERTVSITHKRRTILGPRD